MNIYESIMTGLQEAIEYEQGKSKARKCRMTVAPLPELDAEEIRTLRVELDMTQSVFAAVVGVSVKTVEAWEAGSNKPIGPARRILSIMRSDPTFPQKYELVTENA